MTILKPFWLLAVLVILAGCSPHPGAGKWKAIEDNRMGIKNMSILFEGKSEFSTVENEKILWHCFWGAKSKMHLNMTCTPSTNIDHHEKFEFIVNAKDEGQLSQNGKNIGLFQRLAYQ
ncbi:MAG: hypothetical protein QM479_09265 [Pseudomonadota bacterium]